MNVIEEIRIRLQKYPETKYTIEGNKATIFPEKQNGFVVSIVDNGGSYTVNFDAWHEEYEDADQALNCFTFGLSDDCRLKVTYRGNSAHVWIVEELDEDGSWYPCEWIGCNETGLLAFPFWLKAKHAYLQNTLLKSGKIKPDNP